MDDTYTQQKKQGTRREVDTLPRYTALLWGKRGAGGVEKTFPLPMAQRYRPADIDGVCDRILTTRARDDAAPNLELQTVLLPQIRFRRFHVSRTGRTIRL